ncbi:MAG: acyl-[acyl-carrier-protein] thioesterase [Bacteroidales bacterium]
MNDTNIHKLSELFTIRQEQVDINKNAHITSILDLCLEMAHKHANMLGVGFDNLKKLNCFWVLSRMNVHIYGYPKWEDKIRISTVPKFDNGMFAYRDFKVEFENGDTIANISSSWLTITADTKKIIKPSSILEENQYSGKLHDEKEAPKLQSLMTIKAENFEPVSFFDVDVNAHVNSIAYLRHAIAAFGISFLSQHTLHEISVNYIKETTPNSNIGVAIDKINSNIYKVQVYSDPETISCICELNFNQKR